jgi:hypothetical protein
MVNRFNIQAWVIPVDCGRDAIYLMLFFIVNGHVIVEVEMAEAFSAMCQLYGVVGFMSPRTKKWHESFYKTIPYAEKVSKC